MTGAPSAERRLNDLLGDAAGVTLATAESCSGGGVAARITSVAGSSDYFLGGVVAYGNDAKADVLGVPRALLETRGAVSAECAAAMAEGARRLFGATLAVSTTGIAGPGGATPRKPVGLVYLGLAGPAGTRVEQHRFAGDRAAVTAAAVERALALLVEGVERDLPARP
jgi:nicotinamide-nucleotide amidase